MIDTKTYLDIAAIAVGGTLSKKSADVMRNALATNHLDSSHEIRATKKELTMDPANEAVHDVMLRTIDINLGAYEGNLVTGEGCTINHGEIARISTELMCFINQIDCHRIINQKQDGLPISLAKATEYCNRLHKKCSELISNSETVHKITKDLGLKTTILGNLNPEILKLREIAKQTLGTVRAEKELTSVNEILLRESQAGMTELRRAVAKTSLHALIMACNGKFEANPHYDQSENAKEPFWQKDQYETVNNKYKAGLQSTSQQVQKETREQLLKEMSIVANELRANSIDPFRLHKFAQARGFEAEMTQLLRQCLNSTEPKQINIALNILSSVFSSTSMHTAQIFNRSDDPKARNQEQHAEDAKAALWIFENLFQQKLINASTATNFNEEAMANFFKEQMHNKYGNNSDPAITMLFNFIKCSMVSDRRTSGNEDKEKNLQKAEQYALYLYYLVMKYMRVDPKDTNGLHHMRLFSKLYLDPNFRKQMAAELSGAEQATNTQYELIKQIDQAHREKVNQLSMALEADIDGLINSKAKASEIYKLCEEYCKLEHDIRGLSKDAQFASEINIGKQTATKANQYRMLGFTQMLPKLYDYNKKLALRLYNYYSTCRAQDSKVNLEAQQSAASELKAHIESRLKVNQNKLKIDNSINSVVDKIASDSSSLKNNEDRGMLYASLRNKASKLRLAKANLKSEVKALMYEEIRRQETIKAVLPFKNAGGHIVIDCADDEQLSAAQNIYEDLLILAKLYPNSFDKILGQPELSATKAILQAQFIGIDKADITDRDTNTAKQLRETEASYQALGSLGKAQVRAFKPLPLEPSMIARFKRSYGELAKSARESTNTKDLPILDEIALSV